ncbi:MAG: hypothetical protein KBT39_13300 [Bacteroidales bacterium]|nr:hypothetical protein [Bacteroidales bacterium]
MKQIHGIETMFDFNKLQKCSDLIWFDGPLLSHYMTESGDHYLYYWVESDEEYNRWMLVRTNIIAIKDYVQRRTTLRKLISAPEDGIVWVADVDDNLNFHHTTMLSIAALPEDYLPEENSYYDGECEDEFLTADTQSYSLFVPTKDKPLFSSIIERMGWKVGRVAVL